MRIAIPKEVQDHERRVGLTPTGAARLVEAGHEVIIQTSAGEGAGFPDDHYRAVGARIAPDAAATWGAAELVVKVKQPTEEECTLFAPGSAFFGYTHTETRPWLARAFLERKLTAIAFERVRGLDGGRPLLAPMSRIAGHMAVIIGAQLLETVHGGPGVMVGEVPGAEPTAVVVIGGGVAGESAARTALALGAKVTVFELYAGRREALEKLLPTATVLAPEAPAIASGVAEAMLLINCATVPANSSTHVVTREMVRDMPAGAVIVDVTADVGGAIETTVRLTTHSDPVFVEEGVRHYAVPNIPGVVPRTASCALEAATLPYVLVLAEKGIERALTECPELATGLLCRDGVPVAADIAAVAEG